MKWQPIETAPKDESRILLYRTGWAEAIAVGWWSNANVCWMSIPGTWEWKATHWMPLPDPPEVP